MDTNYKTLASSLIAFSIILLFLLVFVKFDVDTQAAALCERYQQDKLDMKECPAHTSNVSWLIVFAFGIGFLMLGIGIYMLFISKPVTDDMKRGFRQIDVSKLDEDEKKAYELIKSKGGSMYQTDMIRETGFSKVKVTRIIDRMETKGIMERKRRGMANIIVLK